MATSDNETFYSELTTAEIEERLKSIPSKYVKPDRGIPSSDMSEEVKESLRLANTALQEHQDISGKMDKDAVNADGSMLKVKIGDNTYVLNGLQQLIKPNAPTMTDAATYDLTIGSTQNIIISNAYSAQGGKVHYTTNGTTPTSASPSFSGASGNVSLGVDASVQSKDITVKAIVILNGESSDVASTTYTTRRKVSAPTFAYSGDKYDASRTVSASVSTSGATIQLSIDGGAYGSYSDQTISASAAAGKYKVKAVLDGWVDSAEVSSAAVTLNSPKTYLGFTTTEGITQDVLKAFTQSYKLDGIKTATKYTIQASSAGYLWICQPNTLTPGNIFGDATYSAQSGFNAAVKVGSWNCYRITNKVVAGSYDLYLKP